MMDYHKQAAARAAIIAGLLCLLLIACMAVRPQALTGNFDVDKAQPIINQTIDSIARHPYVPEPDPEPSWLDLIRRIWDWWWRNV